MKTIYSMFLLCAALVWAGHSEARETGKPPIFNTFYYPIHGGAFELSLRMDQTFELTEPFGESVRGRFKVTPDHLTLVTDQGERNFTYRIEDSYNLRLVSTSIDTPNDLTLLGRMPPAVRGGDAHYIAAENYIPNAPEAPMSVEDRGLRQSPSWDRGRGHFEYQPKSVLVREAHTEKRWVPAGVETASDRDAGKIRAGHFEDVLIPAQYESRLERVWVEDR